MKFNIDHRFAGLLDIARLIYQNKLTSQLSDTIRLRIFMQIYILSNATKAPLVNYSSVYS